MKIYHTDALPPDGLSAFERETIYNGIDVIATAQVLDAILPQLDNHTAATYRFSRDLQGPCLEMRCRGILVDHGRRNIVLEEFCDTLDRLESQLNRIVTEGCGLWDFNWRNNKDLRQLFYKELGIPEIKSRTTGNATVDRHALEKLEMYFPAAQICKHLIAMRDLEKKIQMLRTEMDNDNRIRTSINIAGTDTGRFSSSFSEFGTGTNLQNIEESLRSIFVADPGYKLAYIDAEQGESRVVGAIEWNLGYPEYLDACESRDLHTTVARLVWPNLPWTGNIQRDRKLAEQPYYRHYDRRFMCKKIGHGSNYGGRPRTLSDQAKVEPKLIEEFQPAYFAAFPGHQYWHHETRRALIEEGYLVNLLGRKRWFWGKRDDDETLRRALAYQGQALADFVNRGLLNVWLARDAILLNQIHDAILVEYPEHQEQTILPKILNQIQHTITLERGRQFTLPYSASTGWNWGKHSEDNPDGIKPWTGQDKRKRSPQTDILDRKFRIGHS